MCLVPMVWDQPASSWPKEICDEYGINPHGVLPVAKAALRGGAALFESHPRNEGASSARQVAALEEKLARKNEVVSELLEELVRLKRMGASRAELGAAKHPRWVGPRLDRGLGALLVGSGGTAPHPSACLAGHPPSKYYKSVHWITGSRSRVAALTNPTGLTSIGTWTSRI
jgi:hypothetical protein